MILNDDQMVGAPRAKNYTSSSIFRINLLTKFEFYLDIILFER